MFFLQSATVMSMRRLVFTTPILKAVCVLIATITPLEFSVMNVLMDFIEILGSHLMILMFAYVRIVIHFMLWCNICRNVLA